MLCSDALVVNDCVVTTEYGSVALLLLILYSPEGMNASSIS